MTWTDSFTRRWTVTVGAVETPVAEAGSGPPILLLHGNPDTHMMWSAIVARLATSYRCLAPDMPGFGASRTPADFDLSLDNQADFVRGLVDALELDRVHLVSHDVGGVYGLAFATLHPQRLHSMTIGNTIFFPDYRWHFWGRVWRTRWLGELANAVATRGLFIRELRRGSHGMPRDYAEHAWSALGGEQKRHVLRWYRAMNPVEWTGWDTRFVNATANVPKQVLWGDRDPFIPTKFADRFGAPVHHFTDLGHWPMLEDPERYAPLIADFVAKHAGARAASSGA